MGIDRAQLPGGRQADMVRFTDFRRPVYCLLGMPIDSLSKSEAVERIRAAVASRLPCRFSTPNVQYLIATQSDAAFRNTLIGGDLTVADGMPLIWIARLLGVPLKGRVAGADLFEALLRGEGGPLKVYFFGGADDVAEMACRRLNALAGPVSCVGFASPGFGAVEQMSAPETIDRINRSGADFVVVSLGAKKGQAWIERNRKGLNAPVISHLGAVLNFTAGTVTRAPAWLQSIGLEWLWRIKEEPALWRRYWSDAKLLLPLVVSRIWSSLTCRALRLLDGVPAPAEVVIVADVANGGATDTATTGARMARARLLGSWAEKDLLLLRRAFETLTREPGDIALDVSELGRVNEAFIALLMLLYGHQTGIGRTLTLSSPDTALRRTLRLHCAGFLLGETGCERNRTRTAK